MPCRVRPTASKPVSTSNPAVPGPPLTCSNPFDWCEVHHDGSVFCCCPAWIGRPLGNLLQHPFDAIWNGERARAIRAAIHDGSFRHCNRRRCPRLASVEYPVSSSASVTDPQLRATLEERLTRLPFGPRRINLCYDRSCNLACPSCRPAPLVATGAALATAATIHTRLFAAVAPGVEELRLCGTGEPLASPLFRPFLAAFAPCAFPNLRRIHLHSNGQLMTPETWRELAAIHPFVKSAEISVDAATAETYARNRGGDWQRLLENLTFIAGLGLELKLSCVVQANNYRELPTFVDLARRFDATAYCSQLVDWRSWDRTEYLARAVHLPGHPEHRKLRRILASLRGDSHVELGNLSGLGAETESSSPPTSPVLA
jgi:Iron-sulfur cluster-binding domain/Radical SAM superfamily